MSDNEKVRVNIYMPQSIIEQIDEFAKALGSNRSVMITTICKNYIDQQVALTMAPDVNKVLSQLKEILVPGKTE